MAIFSARPFVSKPSDYSQRLVLNEENVVIDVAENVSPSVVTVAIKKNRAVAMPFFLVRRVWKPKRFSAISGRASLSGPMV